ncbi:Cilia- and flagella-associated protein 54 [Saguinus oedipus]|uniref:Cilia- and flagella-associated protein 54 n=1 Tax=Saguinus oedipus TaxID=9490 RepID=A0ABQ9UZI2_SAGOE|nr:Cilia- and flagella-associated protein 54 [Saguinus oedipus]
MAKQVYYNNKRKDPSKWLPALHLFDVALKLCKATAAEEREVEAEILFQKEAQSKIERQILMEEKSPSFQLESLYEAIQLSLNNDQNSGCLRSFQPPLRRSSSGKETAASKFEMYSSLAWIAIRAAAQVPIDGFSGDKAIDPT